ncbi:hypothetical protein [Pseudomonas sp. ENNP23]|uniref:hypothetical protein n=1 Tax=Pseudomonas sp. ENNP23 TaxID=1535636 RepID=UPI001112DA55|nr:hypothetical protein [Pseudomonas sp. ENNP23]
MIIAILDPALFDERPEDQIIPDLEEVIKICRLENVVLIELEEYWNELSSELIASCYHRLSPQGKRTIQEIQKLTQPDNVLPRLIPQNGQVWKNGFEDMFGLLDSSPWPTRMANAVIRAAQSENQIFLITRLKENRNLVTHRAQHSTLSEIKRWILHVQLPRIGHIQIPCLYHIRNVSIRWTCRYDWRLPAKEDSHGRYPFAPQQPWWKNATQAFRVSNSKHCWVDHLDNYWARPNITNGSGYHWDVYITNQKIAERIGLNQINIVEHGNIGPEGEPGEIHHTPGDKRPHLKDRGWP